MKKSMIFTILIFSTLIMAQSILFTDLEIAVNLARIEQKKLAIVFTTQTCPYCAKLKNETLTDKTVKELVLANYIFAEALFDYNKKTAAFGKPMSYPELFSAFQVNSVPVTWFFTSEATPLVYLPGYAPAQTFAQVLKYVYQELTEDFQQYMKRKDDFQGERKIIPVNEEQAKYVLKNDPYSIQIDKLPQKIDPYKVYVVQEETLAQQLSNAGVFRVLLVEQD
ncbi:MAG TPA: thioredoxin fold domain-containing protein [Pseudothermotoga sp.]|uniref:thioredoxin family protein n=1 Tax=Thermotoga profunda TaxID=1508420 RepID=UPI0005971612|nr:thioredoxin fold domain-containing protein [Thermotoga profunda]